MKSKLLVLAVLSTISLGAQADEIPVPLASLVPDVQLGIDGSVNVVNFSQNLAAIDASVSITAGDDIEFSQQESVSLEVTGLGDGSISIANDNLNNPFTASTLDTQLSFKAENIGNRIDTSAIGAAVLANTNITTGSNSQYQNFDLEGEYRNYESKYENINLELELDATSSFNGIPTTNVVNTAYNQADINATVSLVASNEAEFQNMQISTSAIGSYALTTTTLAIGVGSLAPR